MLWFPAVQEVTDVRLSMVLARNMYVLWDRTRYFEDWRIHRPCVHFIAFFLCKMSLDPEGETQTVRQMTSWQNGCNSRSCSPIPISLCRGGDETKIWSSSQKSKKILLLMVGLTQIPSTFIYAQSWHKHLNCIHVNTRIDQRRAKRKSAKPHNVCRTHRVQDKQLMSC